MKNSFSDVRWLNCKNVDASPIPPFSCVAVKSPGVDSQGVLQVAPPTADSQDVLITREASIAANGFGFCTMDWPVAASYNPSDGTPAIGDTWGAAQNFYVLRKGKTGFGIVGGVNTQNQTVVVYRVPSPPNSIAFSGAAYTGVVSVANQSITWPTKVFDTATPNFMQSNNVNLLVPNDGGHWHVGATLSLTIATGPSQNMGFFITASAGTIRQPANHSAQSQSAGSAQSVSMMCSGVIVGQGQLLTVSVQQQTGGAVPNVSAVANSNFWLYKIH